MLTVEMARAAIVRAYGNVQFIGDGRITDRTIEIWFLDRYGDYRVKYVELTQSGNVLIRG